MQTEFQTSTSDKNGKRVSRGARMRANRTYHPRHNVAAHYSIHDRKHIDRLLKIQHAVLVHEYQRRKLPTKPPSLEAVLFANAKKYMRLHGSFNRYQPHQGPRELERRRLGGFHTLHHRPLIEAY